RHYLPVELRLETRRKSPEGEEMLTAIQTLRVLYTPLPNTQHPTPNTPPLCATRIEQMTVSRLGENANAVLRTLEVEEATLNAPVAPETLAVAIPKGAEVLDS